MIKAGFVSETGFCFYRLLVDVLGNEKFIKNKKAFNWFPDQLNVIITSGVGEVAAQIKAEILIRIFF